MQINGLGCWNTYNCQKKVGNLLSALSPIDIQVGDHVKEKKLNVHSKVLGHHESREHLHVALKSLNCYCTVIKEMERFFL